MKEFDNDVYSIQFSNYASRLESHLLKHGVACNDADRIIEESSIIYFEKLRSHEKKLFLLKKHDPAETFVRSACQAIESYIPEAKHSFGSFEEISRCIS